MCLNILNEILELFNNLGSLATTCHATLLSCRQKVRGQVVPELRYRTANRKTFAHFI